MTAKQWKEALNEGALGALDYWFKKLAERLAERARKILEAKIMNNIKKERKCICPFCKKEGPHYVPPSFGEEGYFICDPSKVIQDKGKEAKP